MGSLFLFMRKNRSNQKNKERKILTIIPLVIGKYILKFSFSILISPGKLPNHLKILPNYNTRYQLQ
jgi:hypothetical protein